GCRRAVTGAGRPGFGPVPAPFRLAMGRVSWSGTSAVGYHPAGIRPASWSLPLAAGTSAVVARKSNAATAFASASATKSRVPSSERARALGVVPSSGPDGGGSSSVATTAWDRVSRTLTRSVLPEATKTLDPDLLSSSADGCRPAGMKAGAFSRPLPAGENTATVLAPQFETNTDPSGVTATA